MGKNRGQKSIKCDHQNNNINWVYDSALSVTHVILLSLDGRDSRKSVAVDSGIVINTSYCRVMFLQWEIGLDLHKNLVKDSRR